MRTVGDYLSTWLTQRERDLAANTYARYSTIARHQIFPRIGGLDLRDVTPERLQGLYRELARDGAADGRPLLTSTIGQVHRLLHVCFEYATNEGLLNANPADRVSSPRIMGRPPTATA